jgi:hypothetical protein
MGEVSSTNDSDEECTYCLIWKTLSKGAILRDPGRIMLKFVITT